MAWELLFTSDIGLLSLFTIVFILGMAWFIGRYAQRHMRDESRNTSSASASFSKPAAH